MAPFIPWLPLHRLERCARIGEGGEGGTDDPGRSCMVSSCINNDMFCGKFGNTDEDVLARRRRGRGATTTGACTGESPRQGVAARDDRGLRSTASPFVGMCESERGIAGRRGSAIGEGNNTVRSRGDLENGSGNGPGPGPGGGGGGGGRGGNTPDANRWICARISSSSSSSSRMRSRRSRFSSRSVLVVRWESESAERSASVSRSCFSFITWIAACWEEDVADIDVSAVEPEKVVRGAENVGLPHVWPPSEGVVIPRDTLPLRPQEDVDAASENAILEGTKRSSRSV